MTSKGQNKKLTKALSVDVQSINSQNFSHNRLTPSPTGTATTVNGSTSATSLDRVPESANAEPAGERRIVRRSSVICSSGHDKYTFDSEHARNPSRTVNFQLEEKHAHHLGPSSKNTTSVFKESPVPSGASKTPTPSTETNTLHPLGTETVVKRNSLVHPGREDLPKSIYVSGRFQNPWPTWRPPSFTNILKFGFSKDRSNIPPKQELDLVLPIIKPQFSPSPKDGLRVTWLGHATVLVQIHGMNVLTDPMFSERASPSQVVGPKRYRDVPCTIHDLPHLHAVVISHNHYDHLDLNTVTLLNARFGADLRWFVPLGLTDWMQQVGCENVVALDWWEENCVPEFSDISFVFTAAQHWCKRTIGDDNKVLWGGWAIIGPQYRFYYPGDTGYCDVFEQIGHTYGPFDISAIPIGAYEPRWFMKYQHVNPLEAVKIHEDVRSKFSIAVHWGTFALANEYYLDPPMKLRSALEERNIPVNTFVTLRHGESRQVRPNEDPATKGARRTS